MSNEKRLQSAQRCLFVCLITATALFAACDGRSVKQQAALDAAVKSLRKIEAAAQVGTNYQNYGQLLIDAKAQVNECQLALTEEKLKNDLAWVVTAYMDAGAVWDAKIKGKPSLGTQRPEDNTIIQRYDIQTAPNDSGDRNWKSADLDQSIQAIWAQAAVKLGEIARR